MRRTGKARGLLGLLVVGGLLATAVASIGAVLLDECYEDVRIYGAGSNEVNGTYTFDGMQGRKPRFCKGPGCIASLEFKSGTWTIVYGGQDMYYGCSCSSFKPTGWTVGPGGSAPTPRVDGGRECETVLVIDIVPAGEAGLLDRGWPEGETPPIIGERVVSAAYEIGEPITGCVRLLDERDRQVTDEDIRLIVSRVTAIGADYDTVVHVDALFLGYNTDRGAYCFSLLTDRPLNQHLWSPGYYDLRFDYPDDTTEWIRIQLIEPTPDDQG
jgi:hypothetical protein